MTLANILLSYPNDVNTVQDIQALHAFVDCIATDTEGIARMTVYMEQHVSEKAFVCVARLFGLSSSNGTWERLLPGLQMQLGGSKKQQALAVNIYASMMQTIPISKACIYTLDLMVIMTSKPDDEAIKSIFTTWCFGFLGCLAKPLTNAYFSASEWNKIQSTGRSNLISFLVQEAVETQGAILKRIWLIYEKIVKLRVKHQSNQCFHKQLEQELLVILRLFSANPVVSPYWEQLYLK